jgi:hypothetical protein
MKTSKQKVDLVVVIPFGPNDTATDTIRSVQTYAGRSHAIVVIDDTHDTRTAPALRKLGSDVYVFPAPEGLPRGTHGGLYLKVAAALQWVDETFQYKVALRLDTDSLFSGFYPEKEAIAMIAADERIGLLGSYRYTCNGKYRGTSGVTRRLLAEIYVGWMTQPRLARALLRMHRIARKNGYVNGDHCLGAAIFMSPKFVQGLTTSPVSMSTDLKDCGLGDDHLYGLAAGYLGLRQVDFAADPLPLGLSGVGLPDTPENLIRRGKKIVHSVKPRHTEARNYFKKLRDADARKRAAK